MIGPWWHRVVLRHPVARTSRVSPPMFDIHARGILITCSCGKVWAL